MNEKFSYRLFNNPDIGSVNNRPAINALDSVSTTLPSGDNLVVDGVSLVKHDRVLFTNLSDPNENNKVYSIKNKGNQLILQEVADRGSRSEAQPGDCLFVKQGTVHVNKLLGFDSVWIQLNIDLSGTIETSEIDDLAITFPKLAQDVQDDIAQGISDAATAQAAADAAQAAADAAQDSADDAIVGPASSIDCELALFDGVTGKLAKGGSGISSPASGELLSSGNLQLDANGQSGQMILHSNGLISFDTGVDTLYLSSSASKNIALGSRPDFDLITGSLNTILGSDTALALSSGVNSVIIGAQAAKLLETGNNNIAIGVNALSKLVSGSNNLGIGLGAGQDLTSSDNTLVGFQAGQLIGTGGNNVGVGRRALRSSVSGSDGSALGFEALINGTGSGNTAVGKSAGGISAVSGDYNTFLGRLSGQSTTTGSHNIVIGNEAITTSTASIGQVSMGSTTSPLTSMVLGHGGNSTMTGSFFMRLSNNTVADTSSGARFAIRGGDKSAGSGNGGDVELSGGFTSGGNRGKVSIFGSHLLFEGNATNFTLFNPAAGSLFLSSTGGVGSTGADNTIIGSLAGGVMTTGTRCVALGAGTLGANLNGNDGVAVGWYALSAQTSGIGNVAMGRAAGSSITIGAQNTMLGRLAGNNIVDGNYNIAIGSNALTQGPSVSNQMVIGSDSAPITHIVLGHGGQNTTTNNLLLQHSPNGVADSSNATNFTVTASDKTAGTGDGGDLILRGGTSAGGALGRFKVGGGSDEIALHSPGAGSLWMTETGGLSAAIDCTVIGNGAGSSLAAGSHRSVVIGRNAGTALANDSLAIGDKACPAGGQGSTHVGPRAGFLSTGVDATTLGFKAGTAASNQTTYIGREAGGGSGATGVSCTGIGYRSLNLVTGSSNTAIGRDSLLITSSGTANTAVGASAGNLLTTGIGNVILGNAAQVTAFNTTGEFALGAPTRPITSMKLGSGGQNSTAALRMQHSDEDTNDAIAALDFTIAASSKIHGSSTGAGGNLLLEGGASVGGAVGKVLVQGALGVGNSAAATTPGTVTDKIEIFDAAGVSLGFIAVYDAIT